MSPDPTKADASANATRSQAPAIVDANVTRSRAHSVIVTGDTFVDEPERYSIEGRIGAGGMGTVLAAKGSRLGRLVALKVVTADREDLRRRFEREAQVTARLQHPAIVPVYGSGRGRDGQPFYAMKQVTGEPLDKVIAKATTLDKRIALLPKVIAVTEAIAYAHAERVIHRDLKPANILVGAFGETVVIDWGLAKDLALADDDETQSVSPYRVPTGDETGIGKVMGTPAYMPIEQARGERVDERSDVYALGAILYHLLAGVAPFARVDEGSVPWENMLARVLSGPPAPLETLQPGVPPDLLAIVARALATSPGARYPSAGELAEDLKRFQTGQLVGAHRYSTWQLVRRWLKRHRTAVAVGLVAAALLAVGGVVSVTRIMREQEHTEEQRVAAEQHRSEAEDLMGFMLVDLRDKLQPIGKLELLDAVAKKAVQYYEARPDSGTDDEQSRRSLALTNIGDVLRPQGDLPGALREYRAALAIRQQLATKDPTNPRWQSDLAVGHERVGDALESQGDFAGAFAEHQASMAVRKTLAALDSTNAQWQFTLSLSHVKLGYMALARGDAKQAITEFETSLAIREKLFTQEPTNTEWETHLAQGHMGLGAALESTNAVRALEEYRASLAIDTRMTVREPANAKWQIRRALSHEKVGTMRLRQGDARGALEEYRANLAINEALTAKDPTNSDWENNLAVSHFRVGDTLRALGDVVGEIQEFRNSLAIMEKLTAKDPGNAAWQFDRATSTALVGDALLARGDATGAVAEYRAALAIRTKLAANDPTNLGWQRAAAFAYLSVGSAQLGAKDPAGAIVNFQASLAIAEPLVSKDPTNLVWQHDLVFAHYFLGDAFVAQRDPTRALADYRAALVIQDQLAVKDPTNPQQQLDVADVQTKIGNALLMQGDRTGALEEYRAALTLMETLVAQNPSDKDRASIMADLQNKVKTCCAPRRP